MFRKVESTKVYLKIIEQIQELIKEGSLKPGDKLPSERLLATQLGVARPPLREALAALEILGAVESRGGKGNIIKTNYKEVLSRREVSELGNEGSPYQIFEARKAIEPEIAVVAARNATEKDVAAIQECLDNTRTGASNLESASWDVELHVRIGNATHNDLLCSVMKCLVVALHERLWMKMREKTWSMQGYPKACRLEHATILDAIKNGDSTAAYQRMHHHLVHGESILFGE